MSLTVAIQMDPMESININADSSYMMALEAQARGHRLYHYLPDALLYEDGKVMAMAHPMRVWRPESGNQADGYFEFGAPEMLELATTDVILMRQDPPFDMAYITATHFLDLVADKTLVVNNPTAVRNAPEKLFATLFPGLLPPTLITRDVEAIKAFRAKHKDIIIKPIFGNGGAGVFHVTPEDENLGSLLEMFHAASREALICQRYLPEIKQGDKRIILVEGEPVGAVSRMPNDGEARANFHAGGSARKTVLTDREQEICRQLAPTLREQGLIFVGIDVIGEYLTEINVTSPTGIQEINALDGIHIEKLLWDALEARLA
ncbi:MAG TPA: glutathione synthase [Rhodospirillaceae bacterium]|nr:glutathione synthase [Alphaproteobacteria bacterium]MAS47515.1 glutathione synthase [Alphaproteobacteria bacterium]MAX96612.1 glutathione synthase [Alphaproteobacteria bacterium]OUT40995.1 MAG: glutathione synthase [Micavibrio sp. TMED2]HCI46342.1 glutathione synthase [Rhodospirillaceae bacterium]|tara:strand:- start:597 stop:1553 length:957 start_codon:yes stop_codon:yes gene_type:complete